MLFELTGNPPVNAVGYRFDSVAVKEPTFTIDGVFLPLDRFEALGYALLDFNQVKDLADWLKAPVVEE